MVFKYRVRAEYAAAAQPIRTEVAKVIQSWGTATKRPPELVTLFEREIVVREAGVGYRLPIQKQLIPHLEREVQRGAPVELYLAWIGAAKTEPVFLVNEFKALTGD